MENKEFEEMSKKEEKIVIATIIVEIALALITLLTIFLPAVVLGKENYEGLYVAFGGGSNGGMITKMFKFSFMNFLTYFLIVVALVVGFIRLAVPKLDNKVTKIIMLCSLILSAILFPLARLLAQFAVNVDRKAFDLGWGNVVGCLLAIITAIVVVLDFYFISVRGLNFTDEPADIKNTIENEEHDKEIKEQEKTDTIEK